MSSRVSFCILKNREFGTMTYTDRSHVFRIIFDPMGFFMNLPGA